MILTSGTSSSGFVGTRSRREYSILHFEVNQARIEGYALRRGRTESQGLHRLPTGLLTCGWVLVYFLGFECNRLTFGGKASYTPPEVTIKTVKRR